MRYWRQYLVTYGIKDYEKETSTPPTLKWSMAPFVLPHIIRACAVRAATVSDVVTKTSHFTAQPSTHWLGISQLGVELTVN